MRILTKPKVYLICRPQIVEEGVMSFLAEQGLAWPTPVEGVKDAERLVEIAGRCCYMSFGNKAGSKTNQAYLDNLIGIERGEICEECGHKHFEGPAHGSVVEHPCWTFLIVGAGRGFSHEQVRHRVGWAYSQLSTRYCDFEREEEEGTWEPGFVIPPLAQLTQDTINKFEASLKTSQEMYKLILHNIMLDLKENEKFMDQLQKYPEGERKRMLRKAARGAARDILPIATEAIMTMSSNARSLWNTIYMRASEHAEAAIRDIYVQIARMMEKEMPAVFKGLEYKTLWDGTEAVTLPREKL